MRRYYGELSALLSFVAWSKRNRELTEILAFLAFFSRTSKDAEAAMGMTALNYLEPIESTAQRVHVSSCEYLSLVSLTRGFHSGV